MPHSRGFLRKLEPDVSSGTDWFTPWWNNEGSRTLPFPQFSLYLDHPPRDHLLTYRLRPLPQAFWDVCVYKGNWQWRVTLHTASVTVVALFMCPDTSISCWLQSLVRNTLGLMFIQILIIFFKCLMQKILGRKAGA